MDVKDIQSRMLSESGRRQTVMDVKDIQSRMLSIREKADCDGRERYTIQNVEYQGEGRL